MQLGWSCSCNRQKKCVH